MSEFWRNKRVLVTGHTGFKGAWLTLWLCQLGAKITGLALPPATTPALFDQLGLADEVDHHICDIGDAAEVERIVAVSAPEIVLHLAAQPLVRRSYREPVETWRTNVMGTIHLLEAIRDTKLPTRFYQASSSEMFGFHAQQGCSPCSYRRRST